MLGKRSAQRGLFEAGTLYGEFVGRDARNAFYAWLASRRDELFPDELFLSLYVGGWGRPSVPPSLLATVLVLQTYEGVSDDEAAARAAYDLRWKVALSVDVDAKPFAKSTLQEFRAQLIVHEEARTLFQQSLDLAKRRGKLRRDRQLKLALDTTPIFGRGAMKDTYNLLADGIVRVLRVLAGHAGIRRGNQEGFAAWATAAGYARYAAHALGGTSVKGQAALDWDDTAARARFLAALVGDADRVLEATRVARGALEAGSPAEVALVEAAGVLSRVLCQDVERKEAAAPGDAGTGGPSIVEGTAPDRLVAVHDPEMRHGRKSASKRFDGHKAAVGVDTESQLITAVDVLAGNAQDNANALALVAQTEDASGCAVGETYADCAYGDGATRQAFADAGRVLHAKAPVLPNHGGFPKTAFRLDLHAPTGPACTCPGGHTTTTLVSAGRGRRAFAFAAATCAACPLRTQCLTEPNRRNGQDGPPPRRTGPRGRTILLHPQEALLQAARAFQHSPAFAAVRHRRQAAEHRLARLVQLGIRQARYVGRTKTLFQLLLAATVANLTLLAGTEFHRVDASLTPLPALAVGLLLATACAVLQPTATTTATVVAYTHSHGTAARCRVLPPRLTGFRPDF